jgi:hypothetical protein
VWWEFYDDWAMFDHNLDGPFKIGLTEEDDFPDGHYDVRLPYPSVPPSRSRVYLSYYKQERFPPLPGGIFDGECIGNYRRVYQHRIFKYCNELEAERVDGEIVGEITPLRLAVYAGVSPPGIWYPYPEHWEPEAWFDETCKIAQGADDQEYFGLTLLHDKPGQ